MNYGFDLAAKREIVLIVKQVLVIDSAELWISLNHGFAGRDDLRISETFTWESGIRLAEVESRALIIFDCDGPPELPYDLRAAIARGKIDPERVICVSDFEPSATNQNELLDSITCCLRNDLLEIVRAIVEPKIDGEDSIEIDLLAQCEFLGSPPGESIKGFVNLLRINRTSLEFESNRELEVGDCIAMTFVLPRTGFLQGGSERNRILLDCAVQSCVNLEKLWYRGEINRIDEDHADALGSFILARRAQQES